VKYLLLLGRILFAHIFIVKSLDHFSDAIFNHAVGMGVPFPMFLVPFSGLIALLGGLSILFGYKAKIGAWLLIVFLAPTTFFMHRFWETQEGHVTLLQSYCFMKNISLLGACLMIAYFGSGPLSLSKK
jgi:putative oxidoreductase